MAWAKSRKPRVPGKNTSNHNSRLFMLYRRLVHVGETLNRFWALNCIKMRLVGSSVRTRWGSLRSDASANNYNVETLVNIGEGNDSAKQLSTVTKVGIMVQFVDVHCSLNTSSPRPHCPLLTQPRIFLCVDVFYG